MTSPTHFDTFLSMLREMATVDQGPGTLHGKRDEPVAERASGEPIATTPVAPLTLPREGARTVTKAPTPSRS